MYQIDIKGPALKEIGKLPQRIREQAIQEIEFLKTNPRPHGSKKLSGSTDRWRIRIGDYRILYRINDAIKQVYIYRALHRKDVYR